MEARRRLHWFIASGERRSIVHRGIRIISSFTSLLRALPFLAAFVWFSPSDAGSTAVLTCSIVDAGGGAGIPARCRVVNVQGNNFYPSPDTSFFSPASGGYFYTRGSFSCTVSTGPIVVTVKHGFEYREAISDLIVRADTSIVIALDRIASMGSLGWYSGDTHVHINHGGGYYNLDPEDALLMARAEGLAIANCLDNEYYFTGASDECSTPECVIFMSQEWRSSSFGHLGLLGMRSLVPDFSSAWWPMNMDVADSAHARPGALVISAHPVPCNVYSQIESWPGSGLARELPIDCIAHRVDAMDVMSYSNLNNGGIELALWYRLLNCGFRIPASAGTDACMNRLDSNPLGGFRTYGHIDSGSLSAYGWFEALAAGRTFITNGPLITRFEVEGRSSGDSVSFAEPGAEVPVEISVRSIYPVNRLEVVMNGHPAVTVLLEPPRSSIDTSLSLVLGGSSWVASRVYGTKSGWITPGDFLLAHSSPVYVTVGDEPILERDDAEFFLHRIEDLEILALTKGQWVDTLQSARVFQELAAAHAWYARLAYGSTADAGGTAPATPSALRCENAPNPFGNNTEINFDVPASLVSLTIYDASGRLLRSLVEAPLPAGRHRVVWDGRDEWGRNVASGVYFARICAGGRALNRKMVVVR